MTRAVTLMPQTRRSPGDIRRGDEVYLNHAEGRGELQRLGLLSLSSSLGGSGPFSVLAVAAGRVLLKDAQGQSAFPVSLSSLTRERPLSAATINPFAPLRMPAAGLAMKL
jgi:hypothetical protein